MAERTSSNKKIQLNPKISSKIPTDGPFFLPEISVVEIQKDNINPKNMKPVTILKRKMQVTSYRMVKTHSTQIQKYL